MLLLIVVQHRFELWVPPAWFAERLRQEFPELEVLQFTDYRQAEPYLPRAEVMITWSLRPEQVEAARTLRWIHSTAAAVHALLIPEVVSSNVVVTNASSVHGPVVAEHAMAMMLALARRLPAAMQHQQRRHWAQDETWQERPRPRELSGARLAVVGVGAIGGAVARLALAFGMKLTAVRERPERSTDFLNASGPHSEVRVIGFGELDEALAEGDFVVLAAPLTPSTRGLIDATRLARMRREAYLVNVGRGALVDQAALIEALQQKRIGGAALDVFEQEPLPADSPLWALDNVLITPHSAGFSGRMWERHYELFSDNLRRYLRHEPLRAQVDKRKGY